LHNAELACIYRIGTVKTSIDHNWKSVAWVLIFFFFLHIIIGWWNRCIFHFSQYDIFPWHRALFTRLLFLQYSRVTQQFRRFYGERFPDDTAWKIFFCMNRRLLWETLPLPLIWLLENRRIPSSVVVARLSCGEWNISVAGICVIYSLNK